MKPIDRKRLRTVSAKRRHSKVNTGDFAKPVAPSAGFASFYDSLPDILEAGHLRELGMEVELQPEYLSTNEARRRASSAGLSRDQPVDHVAAQIILEDFLAIRVRRRRSTR